MVNVTIDGIAVKVKERTTILDAAKKAGVNIPNLCYFRELNEWIASAEKAEKQFFADKGIRSWAYPDTDESSWRDVTFPGFLQDQVPLETACNGFYYCRKTFEIFLVWP